MIFDKQLLMRYFVFLLLLLPGSNLFAQKVIADTIFPVRSSMRYSQLVNVTEDPSTGNIQLIFRQTNQTNSRSFFRYTFSPELQLLENEMEDQYYSDEDHLRRMYPNYRGEHFTEEGFAVQQSMRIGDRQKIEFIRYYDSYTWNWFIRDYFVQRQITGARDLERLQDEKYYLVHQFYHPGVDKVFALIAFKEKGKLLQQSPHSRVPLLEHYQLLRIDRDLNMEVLREWNFQYKMELVRAKKLEYTDDEHFLGEERNHRFPDPNASMLYVFAPAGSAFISNKDPKKGNWLIVKVSKEGAIAEMPLLLYGSGWKMMDIMHRNDTLLLWGPAKPNRYYTALPTEPRHEISKNGKRYQGFQLVRIVGDRIDKISYHHQRSFHQQADKQAKRLGISYRGRQFLFSYAKMGPKGEFFVGGQRIMESEVRETNGTNGQTRSHTVRNGYRQPLLICFDEELKLDIVYGYRYYRWLFRRDDAVSPMWVRRSPEGKWYWEVSELYDVRTYGYTQPVFNDNVFTQVFGPSVYTSMNKYLFFPRLIPIDPSKAKMEEPVNIGLNSKGRQRYYSDNLIPWKYLSDGSILYIGFDGSYSKIWLGRVRL